MQKETKKQSLATLPPLRDILGTPCSRDEALAILRLEPETYQIFCDFPTESQEDILRFIQGQQGLPITYDTFFKKIMDPKLHPERLNHFLSAILNQPVTIKEVLPREGNKLVDEGSLIIMDIVVETVTGAFINVEMQKIGYAFPGERSSCYTADFIMRQYNRVKSEKGQNFSFKDLKPVFLIVLMERSSGEFNVVAPHYIHREQTSFDSGSKVTTLTNIMYISLDTFHRVVHNISNNLDAWLTFLSSDKPDDIIRLINAYPEFKPCYQDIVEFRKNPKELIYMYSEALTIMDRNTVKYMCEEQQKVIDEQAAALAEQATALAEKDNALNEKDKQIAELMAKLQAQNK